MAFVFDRRQVRVVLDHAQTRVSKPRIGVTTRGFDFLEGELTGMWVSPVTGVLQSIPNSEEKDYQTTATGRWTKFTTSTVSTFDNNASAGSFSMAQAQGMHPSSAIFFTGDNTAGVGAITNSALSQNTGVNVAQYVYGAGTETDAVLVQGGWNSSASSTGGEAYRVFLDGRIEVYRNGYLVGKGSFGGGGYQFGSAKGGSYVRASDQYVQVRIEAYRDRYLLFTSSIGGVFQFACPWAVERYNADGSLQAAKEPILSANKAWFSVPKGGCSVVWSAVQYAPSGTAISEVFALSQAPGTTDVGSFAARCIPDSSAVAVSLVRPDSPAAFDASTNGCRVKVVASGAPVWIDGTSTRWDPVPKATTPASGGGTDVSLFVRDFDMGMEDGPEGFGGSLTIATHRFDIDPSTGAVTVTACPASLLESVENRPVRIDLVANPDDPSAPATIVLLNGVLGPPEYVDALRIVDGQTIPQTVVRFEAHDKLVLLKDAEVSETVVFDGSYLCRSSGSGDSAVAVCLRQMAIEGATSLPDLDFVIQHVPPQRAGDWAFEARPGDKWYDVLVRLFDLAPSLVWGIRPMPGGVPEFYVVDPDAASTSVGTLYRNPADAAAGGAEVDAATGAFPALYDGHSRKKLPREGNLVRVMGFDPTTQKALTAFRSDDDSRNPQGLKDADWLGNTRTVKYSSPGMTTQPMVERVADSLGKAVSQRQFVEPFASLVLFLDSGRPAWRGDVVTLSKAMPDGSDSSVLLSSFRVLNWDEAGGGEADSSGRKAPVAIRRAEYTAGALVGLGGIGHHAISQRHKRRIQEGGWMGRGSDRLPSVSPFSATVSAF